ncbi:hypothetical protein RND81_02G007400 [Saponaria officinalis]|uniref:Cytochrome P450 n=1 Tax=Saponaria officinalis TaxID=3572 RepID=A0AAW1MSD3_SAPOF
MVELTNFLLSLLLILPSFLLLLIIIKNDSLRTRQNRNQTQLKLPKSYPIIGHFIAVSQQKDTFQWITNLLISSPSSTFILHRPFGLDSIQTVDPNVIEHILKTEFHVYQKGPYHRSVLRDFLGDGIFNVEGESWKFQRRVCSYEFSAHALKEFVEKVVDFEVSSRLIPILSRAARDRTVLDLQDILERFTFDNICKISFGYDPKYLDPSLPNPEFAVAFEEATMISTRRFRSFFPFVWKICRFLNIGSEKRLKKAVFTVREFAMTIVKEKKQSIINNCENSEDLLSRFLKSGHSNETLLTDIVISFLVAGRESTSAALTWFFWLIHKNKEAEKEILKELKNRGKQGNKTEHLNSSVFEQVKQMVYTQAALCETMRLFPPVPVDIREAVSDDILPDGTLVKKGTWVTYHPYAMGRLEKLWGVDCAEYRPERWLEEGEDGLKFVPRDACMYPVFHVGPRVCLGKEMAFLQMKRVVAGVLSRFRVVPAVADGVEPVYVPYLTAKMHGGFPVMIEERCQVE